MDCWPCCQRYGGVPFTETEEHPFAMRPTGDHRGAGEGRFDITGRGVAVDTGVRMGVHGYDLLALSWFPDPAGEFNFGKFGHFGYGTESQGSDCKSPPGFGQGEPVARWPWLGEKWRRSWTAALMN